MNSLPQAPILDPGIPKTRVHRVPDAPGSRRPGYTRIPNMPGILVDLAPGYILDPGIPVTLAYPGPGLLSERKGRGRDTEYRNAVDRPRADT